MKGKFIVLEGLDGSGKDVQALKIVEHLKKRGHDVVRTKEHRKHSTPGKKITEIVKKEKDPKKKAKELYALFLQDRKEHNEDLIKPNLEAGNIVVCVRYKYSTIAYQQAQGTPAEKTIKDQADFLVPDLVLFFDVPPDVCLKRLKKTGKQRTVFEKKDFLEKVRKNFLKLKEMLPEEYIVVIEASGTIEEVFEEVKKQIDRVL